jgi:hypothetical protein
MTPTLFALFLVVLICAGFLCACVVDFPFVVKRLTQTDAVAPPTAATIAIMFALFVAFGTSDVMQRSHELRLSVQKEINVARSIFKFAESVGPSANPVRQALIEYLQAVTALEQAWLEGASAAESPAQATADTLVQVVTLFVVQSPAPSSVKAVVFSKVDELRQARTERILLSRRSSAISAWVGLLTMAVLTQLIVALGYVGKPNARRAAVGCFTAAAVSSVCYLAWIDGLISPSKVADVMLPLRALQQATAF